jgi:two-component system, sensor histidine kinase and response regulator
LKALVIEDSLAGRLLIRTILEHFGFGVDFAIDAASACRRVAATAYSIITVDRMLGQDDGVVLTRELKRILGAQRPTRIIAVTGRVEDGDREAFLAAGSDGFLPKPVSARALGELLNRFNLAAPTSVAA